MLMKYTLTTTLLLLLIARLHGQEAAWQTFKDRWVINSPSVEVLSPGKLDVRIGHRFGDFAGDAGGWSTMYGLENAADVSVGFEYGLLNNLTAGFSRSKGAGPLRQLLHGSLKYRALSQSDQGVPLSLALFGLATLSTAERSEDSASINYFEVFPHRLVYHFSAIAARKFSDRLSLQLSAGLTHRNVVPKGDENNLAHAGAALRLKLTKVISFIGDLSLPLNGNQSPFKSLQSADDDYQLPLGLGLEFDTGGHVFQLNFTNTAGIMPTDYMPYTRSDWTEGQFRIGFTISRMFSL